MKIIKTAFIIFFIQLSCSTIVVAQNSKIDSLNIQLKNHKENDSVRVDILNELAFSYFSKDLLQSLKYLDKSDSINKNINYIKGKARSIYIRGITKAIQANYEQALHNYKEALKLYENINFKKGIANCYNAMGITYRNKGDLRKSVVYFKNAIMIEEEIESNNLSASLLNLGTSFETLGDFDEAILYLNKALAIAKTDDNEQRIAYSLNNLGNVYQSQGNYPVALEHFNKSLYIHEKLGDSIGISNNLFNMGIIYKTQKNYEKALQYYEKALKIDKRTNRRQGISAILNSIGMIHEEKGDFQSALDHYLEALNIGEEIGEKGETPFILNNIGGVYLELNEYGLAKKYFSEAKKISIEIGSKKALCETYIGLSKTYAIQKDYKNALNNALNAKGISKKNDFLDQQKQTSEILSNIYEATRNYKDALDNYQQFKILNDSLFNKKNIEKIAQLEYDYKYKQALDSASLKELELKKTVTETNKNLVKTQRNYLWAIIGVLLVSMLLGLVVFYQKLKNAKTKTQNAVIEQKLLRSQMTPHFIFNSLSVLQGMILNKESKKSVSYLSKFSKLLRITLENSRDKTVSLSQELKAIQNYLTLQNLENDEYQSTLLVEDSIDVSQFKVPPMLIQPFVENAIEHAFINQQDDKKIDIRLTYTNKKLVCSIIDNGIGFESKNDVKNVPKKSLSTTITSERLEILSKDFKMQGSVTIEDRKKYNAQGTIVTLVIPHKLIA